MATLLLSRRHSDDSNAMWRACRDLGWDVGRLQSYAAPPGLRERDPVLYARPCAARCSTIPCGLSGPASARA